ncbi:TonB-dependent receptor [Trichloromonas sp.]|uniref:TonB-dependent receptor n=1 Tax=Trichloromonas sp. TaxID=3069249 RepID=UPI002A4985A6|nr:TonB-dependent receptor [Trichloromonas sp.]
MSFINRFTTTIILPLFSCCCLLLSATNVFATGNVHMLDTVVVTATRSEDPTFEVPSPVSTVDEQRLQETAPASVADAIADVPGVFLDKAGSWEATPIIRGLGETRVLVLHDGDRETNLWAGRMPLTPFMDMGSVARIEVVKGPASALYGTDALGGVINIISREVQFAEGEQWQMESTLKSRYSSADNGSFGRYELAAGGNGLGLLLGVSGRDMEDYEDGNDDDVRNSQFESRNIDLKARYALNNSHNVTTALRINNITDMGVPQKNPEADYSHFDRFDTRSYKLGYEGSGLGFVEELTAKIYAVDQDRSFESIWPNSTGTATALKSNDIATYALGGSIQALMLVRENHSLISGLEVVCEATDSSEVQLSRRNSNNSLARRLTFQPVPDGERTHIGVFIQDEAKLGKKLTLLAGGRFDHFEANADDIALTDEQYNGSGALTSSSKEINKFDDAQDSAATFNLGLLYALTEHLHLTANVGSGFRAPDIFELFSTRGGGSRIMLGNPDLDPESSISFDIGSKVRYSAFQASFNLFYNRVDDFIDTEPAGTFNGIDAVKYVNVQNAELYGFDGETQFCLTEKLALFGSISSVVGKDRDSGDRLNNIPPLNGTLGVRWKDSAFNTAHYWVELSSNFFAAQNQPGPSEEETPGYAITNLRTGLDFPAVGNILHDVRLTLNVENLFDKYYLSHLRKEDVDFIPGTGVNVIAAAEFSF